jgi:hypothetical protein
MLNHNVCKSFAILVAVLSTTALFAQESKPEAPAGTYKLDYVFSEMQDNKRVNARSYTALVRVSEKGVIKIGSRVPIATSSSKEGETQFQYLDIGTSIDCFIRGELDSAIDLTTNVEVSSVSPVQSAENRTGAPVVRQVRYQLRNNVPLGKQTLLGSGDEVDGTKRFQIEVTASKMR